ncbi:unnamed protein product [Onchocerca flexuosa]|uniref:Uncharacterized protein n=1 Tax=Onchocerca flexuosa TaxID=387005 RepID=A0A183HRS8_9BILA|nr:unnamed protein product [Onchocerca flexuosa]
MRLNNNSSSASVASRLYTNGARGSQRGSFGSEPELMSFSDNETSLHELNEICSQKHLVLFLLLYILLESLISPHKHNHPIQKDEDFTIDQVNMLMIHCCLFIDVSGSFLSS